MMKIWNTPAAVAQRFAANEYVSACTASIKCDVDMNGYAVYMIPHDPVVYAGNGKTYEELPYTACGAEHSVELNGQLMPLTITKAGKRVDGQQVYYDLETPVEVYFWELYNEEGQLLDFHATTSEDGFQSNMS